MCCGSHTSTSIRVVVVIVAIHVVAVTTTTTSMMMIVERHARIIWLAGHYCDRLMRSVLWEQDEFAIAVRTISCAVSTMYSSRRELDIAKSAKRERETEEETASVGVDVGPSGLAGSLLGVMWMTESPR